MQTWPSTRARFCESTAVCAFNSPTLDSSLRFTTKSKVVDHSTLRTPRPNRFCESTAVCAFSSPTLLSIEGSGFGAHPTKHHLRQPTIHPIRPHLSKATKHPVRTRLSQPTKHPVRPRLSQPIIHPDRPHLSHTLDPRWVRPLPSVPSASPSLFRV